MTPSGAGHGIQIWNSAASSVLTELSRNSKEGERRGPYPRAGRGPAVRPHLAVRRLRAGRTTARVAGTGTAVEIEAKPLEVLRTLLVHAGEVVTKGELLEAVWPGTAVVDGSLATAISKVRKLLGDDEKVIVTVPRVGYKLAAPVHCKATSESCACGTASFFRDNRFRGGINGG